MKLSTVVIDKYKKDGIISLLHSGLAQSGRSSLWLLGLIYQYTVRRFLPYSGYIERNGIKIARAKVFDRSLPNEFNPNPPSKPEYKSGNVKFLVDSLSEADYVVVIGGGYGVTSIHAAKAVGPEGQVNIFEASREHIEILKRASELNQVSDRCQINHAIVGPDISIFGSFGDPAIIDPVDLPDSDVLELDCEGAELAILSEMEINPKTIIVEIHPHKFDDEPGAVIKVLEERGYSKFEYRDQNGMKLTNEQFIDLLTLDRNTSKTTSWGAVHPPIVKAVR